VTKNARRKERQEIERILNPPYVPKLDGTYHVLDDGKGGEERDQRDGSYPKGVSGLFDIRRLERIQGLEEEVDWHVANPDRPASSSPMNRSMTPDEACRKARLTDAQREAMLMHLNGDSPSLIAQELEISVGAVQNRLAWGRLKLKITFGDVGLP
jgi:hypothetical protein